MEDMKMEDLNDFIDDPKQQLPSRTSRFAPKGSKFQLKPIAKNKSSSSLASLSLSAPKKEEVDVKFEVKPKLNIQDEVLDDLIETEAVDIAVEREDGEDEVFREIDVYFAPSVDRETQLYMFQYPLRPLWRPYELDEICEEVRVKPTRAEVEVDLTIDVDSKNYYAGADERLQRKKQILATTWKQSKINGCTVGFLNGNKLHLNPIHEIVQLRPSKRHLDQNESKKRTAVKSEEHQELRPSGMPKKQRTQEQTIDNEEGWVPLKYHSVSSDVTSGYLKKMIAREGSQINFSMSSGDYLNSLCPATSDDSLSSKGPSTRSLLAKPLKERFRTWFLEGPPIHRFDALKHLAPDESIEEVLAVLQEFAVLIQGLWVPKTSLVCETQGCTVSARNYVLLIFSKDVTFKEDQIPRTSQLAKAIKDVLHALATHRPGLKDWRLKVVPDLNFIKLNPAVVKKQREEWESVEKEILSCIFGGRNGPGKKTLKSTAPVNLVTPKGSAKLAAATSSGSTPRNAISEELREAIKKALLNIFKSTKTCSFQQIIQRLRDIAVDESAHPKGSSKEAVAAACSIEYSPDELQAVISEVAVNIHGICVPKSSPDHPEHDDIRKIVIDLFLARGPNAKLKRADISAGATTAHNHMSEIAYKKVMQELCVSQGSAWVLRD